MVGGVIAEAAGAAGVARGAVRRTRSIDFGQPALTPALRQCECAVRVPTG